MKIIDTHSHWGTEEYYPLRGKAALEKQKLIWKTEARYWTKQEQADYFRQNEVRAILDFGISVGEPMDKVRRMHDDAIEYQKANPDVILGNWLQVHADDKDCIREFERVVDAKAGFTGVAISAHRHKRSPVDPSFTPIYEYCQSANIPVMVFVGWAAVGANQPGGDSVLLDWGHPRYIDLIAATYPKLQIVTGRSAWPWASELIGVMLHKPNVWAEFHGMSPRKLTAETREEIGTRLKKKIMFGCDFPMLRYEKIAGDWKLEGYSDEVIENVFYKNAETFLGRIKTA